MDGKSQNFMEPLTLIPHQVWLEQQFRGSEARRPHLWRRWLRRRVFREVSVPFPTFPWSASVTALESGLATYIKRAAVWKGVLHLLSLESLVLLWVDGQIASSLYGQGRLLSKL